MSKFLEGSCGNKMLLVLVATRTVYVTSQVGINLHVQLYLVAMSIHHGDEFECIIS